MLFPLPPIGVSSGLLPFAAIAGAMVAITIVVLGLIRTTDGRPPLVTQMLLGVLVLLGGSVLLLALLFVFRDPDGTTAWTWVLVAFNFMMMAPIGCWFIGVVLLRDRRVGADGWGWPAAVAGTVTGSEVLMGLLFAVGGASGPLSTADALALGLSSVWFFWSMAAVMAALIAWAPLGPAERAGSASLAAAAVLAPWVATYPLVGGAAMTVLMTVASALLLRLVLVRRVAETELGLLIGLSGAFMGMAASGALLAGTGGSDTTVAAFGAVMGGAMVGEVGYLVRRGYRTPSPRSGFLRLLYREVPEDVASSVAGVEPRT